MLSAHQNGQHRKLSRCRCELTPSGHRCDVNLTSSQQRQTLEAALAQSSIAVILVVVECALFKPRPKEVAVGITGDSDGSNGDDSESDATPPLYASSESSDEMTPAVPKHNTFIDDEADRETAARARWEFRNKDLIWIVEKLAQCRDLITH